MNIRIPLGALLLAIALSAAATPGIAPPPATGDQIHAGTVTEILSSGGYTYLRIDEGGQSLWLAAKPLPVEVGDRIEYAGGDEMKDFASSTLKRTFPSIRFVSRIHVVSDAQMPQDDVHRAAQAAGGGGAAVSVTAPRAGEIAPAPGGKTVAQIYGAKDALAGQPMVLRAKVVKFSANILGKNWVTLADGTGQAPNDRIVATTLESPALGTVVTVNGVVRTQVDLGSGYKYAAVIEQAQFTAP